LPILEKLIIIKGVAQLACHPNIRADARGIYMQPKKSKLLKIFVSSTDVVDHRPLYEGIIRKANKYGIDGASAIKGIMGYGISTELHNAHFFALVEKFPVVVEIIASAEKIDGFLKEIMPWLEAQPKGCLVVTQEVEVHLAKKGDTKL